MLQIIYIRLVDCFCSHSQLFNYFENFISTCSQGASIYLKTQNHNYNSKKKQPKTGLKPLMPVKSCLDLNQTYFDSVQLKLH